jgi:hypothetical protein
MFSERLLCACGVAAAAFALTESAFAHAGRGAPVATNFQARLNGLAPASRAVEAKVVDGDRQLWLRARPDAVVLVPGAAGEPLLRFDRVGVSVNLRSVTAQTDRIDRLDLRPDPDPRAHPVWHRLTAGHAYRWHEHRLHALEALARGRGSGELGRWRVPLIIDARRHELRGVLVYRRPPSAWPGVLVVALAVGATGALAAWRMLFVPAALFASALVWVVRIGRALYGRPDVGIGSYVNIALTSVIGVGLVYGLVHRDVSVRRFVALLAAAGCLYEGLTMLGVLTHAVALSELPTPAVRLAVATFLGVGAALLVTTFYEGNR